MAQTTTASVSNATDGQIDAAVNKFRDALRKKREEFPSDALQRALGTPNFGMRLLEPLRELVEMHSNVIVRKVLVPARSFASALDATGRAKYLSTDVVNKVPTTTTDGEREVIFAKPPSEWYQNSWMSCARFAEFLDTLGLEPDPHGVAAVNEADPAFADTHPNATQWVDAHGKYCCAAFFRWNEGRSVDVRRSDSRWIDGWWVGGRRK